jgi:hypothetical protein
VEQRRADEVTGYASQFSALEENYFSIEVPPGWLVSTEPDTLSTMGAALNVCGNLTQSKLFDYGNAITRPTVSAEPGDRWDPHRDVGDEHL